MIFDIVVCLGPHDINKIDLMMTYTKQNVIGYRNIYIISYDKGINVEGCITIDEKIFPFNIEYIRQNTSRTYSEDRSGWYLQQLLKLYACICIDNILDNILIIDCDTFFYNKVCFFEGNIPLYNFSSENHAPYFNHMLKLHPKLQKYDAEKSGICHHMVMQKYVILNLFKLVETYHNKPFYQVFIECINPNDHSGASEYEIYFNYMLKFVSKDLYKLRRLDYTNTSYKEIANNKYSKYHYVSYHWYM